MHVGGRDFVTPIRNLRRGRSRRCADDAGGGIHGKEYAGLQRAGRYERHDPHEAFEQHRSVADVARVLLARDHLRRGAGGNQGVKTGDGAAGDGDEAEREDLAREDGAGPVDEARQTGQLQLRMNQDHAEAEQQHHAELYKCAEVVARSEQHPYRQRAHQKAVEDDGETEGHAGKGENRRERRRLRDGLAAEDRQDHQPEADERRFQHFSGPPVAEVEAHEQRDRHHGHDGERAPGTVSERIHHHQGNHRQEDDHDQQHRQYRREAADLSDFIARHLAERFAVTPHGAEQDHKVLHRAADYRAEDDPQRAGKIAELRGESRADQRTRTGDCGEVVAEEDPFVHGLEIVPVAQALGGGGAAVVERHHFRRDEFRVETETHGVGADGRNHDPHAVDRLAAIDGDPGETERGEDRNKTPDDMTEYFH